MGKLDNCYVEHYQMQCFIKTFTGIRCPRISTSDPKGSGHPFEFGTTETVEKILCMFFTDGSLKVREISEALSISHAQ